jgi:hypothetical protein
MEILSQGLEVFPKISEKRVTVDFLLSGRD